MNSSQAERYPSQSVFYSLANSLRRWVGCLEWHRSHWLFLLLIVLSTVVFWTTDLDIDVMRHFFVPDHTQNAWPIADQQPWLFFYKAAPFLTLIPTLAALLTLIASRWIQRLVKWRSAALFIVLCFALGPGLTVNLVFKDHWGRPRPRQVIELGGQNHSIPPLAMGDKGKSFPCGHSSVGFAYGAFCFILRKKRPRIAAAVLSGSLILGLLMGIGRMAAGAHFLSDVLWSAYLPLVIAFLLSPMLSTKPKTSIMTLDNLPAPSRWRRYEPAILILLVGVFLCGALLAFPFKKSFSVEIPPQDLAISTPSIVIIARNATVDLSVSDQPGNHLFIKGQCLGFGTPFNALTTAYHKQQDGMLSFNVQYQGLFTDIESHIRMVISRSLWEAGFSVFQKEGDRHKDQPNRIRLTSALK